MQQVTLHFQVMQHADGHSFNDKQRLEYNGLYLFENLIKQYFCIPPSELLFFLGTSWTYEVLTWCFSFYGNTKIVV